MTVPFYANATSRKGDIKGGPNSYLITASGKTIVDKWYDKMKVHGIERTGESTFIFDQAFSDCQQFIDYLEKLDRGDIQAVKEEVKAKDDPPRKWYKRWSQKRWNKDRGVEGEKDTDKLGDDLAEQAEAEIREQIKEFKGHIFFTSQYHDPNNESDGGLFRRQHDLAFMRPYHPPAWA